MTSGPDLSLRSIADDFYSLLGDPEARSHVIALAEEAHSVLPVVSPAVSPGVLPGEESGEESGEEPVKESGEEVVEEPVEASADEPAEGNSLDGDGVSDGPQVAKVIQADPVINRTLDSDRESLSAAWCVALMKHFYPDWEHYPTLFTGRDAQTDHAANSALFLAEHVDLRLSGEIAGSAVRQFDDRILELTPGARSKLRAQVDKWLRDFPSTSTPSDHGGLTETSATAGVEGTASIGPAQPVDGMVSLFAEAFKKAVADLGNSGQPKRGEPGRRKNEEKDIDLWLEYRQGLEDGQWGSKAEYARTKKVKPNTMRVMLNRGEEASKAKEMA